MDRGGHKGTLSTVVLWGMTVVGGVAALVILSRDLFGWLLLPMWLLSCVMALRSNAYQGQKSAALRIVACAMNLGLVLGMLVYCVHGRPSGPHPDSSGFTRALVRALDSGLRTYMEEEGMWPGQELLDGDGGANPRAIGVIVAELVGKNIVRVHPSSVWLTDNSGHLLREAREDELLDYALPKAILDGWGTPLVLRFHVRNSEKAGTMRNPEFVDIYSKGPNMKDDTSVENVAPCDDIGNW